MFDIVCVGNRTEDIILKDNGITRTLGGPVTYSSLCLKKLKAKVGIVTDTLKMIFEISYKNNIRAIKILRDGGKIESISKIYSDTKAVLFCPVFNEIEPQLIEKCIALKAIGIQGILRVKKGEYIYNDLPVNFFDFLSVDIVSMSKEEAGVICNRMGKTGKGMCEEICNGQPKIITITLGEEGSLVYDDTSQEFVHIPAYKTKIIDETGAGDVYISSFLYYYINTKDAISSGYFASAASSFIVEDSGPRGFGTEKEILERMQHLQMVS